MRFHEGFVALCILDSAPRHSGKLPGRERARRRKCRGNKEDQRGSSAEHRQAEAGLHSAARLTNRFTGTSGNQAGGRGGRVGSALSVSLIKSAVCLCWHLATQHLILSANLTFRRSA